MTVVALARTASMLQSVGRRYSGASQRVSRTIAGTAGLTPSFPSRFPEMRQLLALAFASDPDVSAMACLQLRRRLDRMQGAAQ